MKSFAGATLETEETVSQPLVSWEDIHTLEYPVQSQPVLRGHAITTSLHAGIALTAGPVPGAAPPHPPGGLGLGLGKALEPAFVINLFLEIKCNIKRKTNHTTLLEAISANYITF